MKHIFFTLFCFFPLLLSAQLEPVAINSPEFAEIKQQLQSQPNRFHLYADYWYARFSACQNIDTLRILKTDFKDQFSILKSKYGEVDSLLLAEANTRIFYSRSLFAVWRKTMPNLDISTLGIKKIKQLEQSVFKESAMLGNALFPLCQRIPDTLKSQILKRACKRAALTFEYMRFRKALEEVPAPDVAFTDFLGKTRHISDFRGQFVLLHFWSTHSVPSMEQLPKLQKIREAYHAKNLEIISISYDPISTPWDLEVLKNFVIEKKMDWVNTVDDSLRSIHKAYRINNWPGFFLLNKAGFAAPQYYFPPDSLSAVLERFIE